MTRKINVIAEAPLTASLERMWVEGAATLLRPAQEPARWHVADVDQDLTLKYHLPSDDARLSQKKSKLCDILS